MEVLKFEDLPKFKYLRAIQDETLRLHPSVPQDVRFSINDDTFPDGTFVRYVCHLNQKKKTG